MAQEWYVAYDVTTKNRIFKKSAKVSDPAKHYGEHLSRFYRNVVKVEWWETDANGKEIGPHVIVDFNDDGTVKSRTPDIDAAHVGGRGWKADPDNLEHTATGTSRAGIHPRDNRDIGTHPQMSDDDEGEPISEKIARVLPEGGLEQPPLNPVGVSPLVVTEPVAK